MNVFKIAASKENKKLNIIFGSTAIEVLIAATYLTFSRAPIASRVSLWQAGIMNKGDEYFPALTILLLALPPLLLLLTVKIIILKFTGKKQRK